MCPLIRVRVICDQVDPSVFFAAIRYPTYLKYDKETCNFDLFFLNIHYILRKTLYFSFLLRLYVFAV